MEGSTTPMTMGMRVDKALNVIETMPSTHLYGVLLIASVAFSFLLLNCGSPSTVQHINNNPALIPTPSVKSRSAVDPDEPQPKWFILKGLNFAVMAGFILSLVKFVSNASTYLNDSSSLFRFLAVWSFFLCYFFGFFGISFVDADAIAEENSGTISPASATNGSSKVANNARYVSRCAIHVYPV
jgi:hypothetical protein